MCIEYLYMHICMYPYINKPTLAINNRATLMLDNRSVYYYGIRLGSAKRLKKEFSHIVATGRGQWQPRNSRTSSIFTMAEVPQ